jgi:hypothetical protein
MRRALEELRGLYRKFEERHQHARCLVRSRIIELLMEAGFKKSEATLLARGFLDRTAPPERILGEHQTVANDLDPDWRIVREGYVDGHGCLTPKFYDVLSKPGGAKTLGPTRLERLLEDE